MGGYIVRNLAFHKIFKFLLKGILRVEKFGCVQRSAVVK